MANDIIELAELLAYQNPRVVQYFCHHHPELPQKEVEQRFKDLLAWIWLHHYRQLNNQSTYLFGPLLVLDELWHAFILHTKEYWLFCHTFFKSYVHHDIEPIGNEHEVTPDELASFLQDCFEHLGDAWVLRYFSNYI